MAAAGTDRTQANTALMAQASNAIEATHTANNGVALALDTSAANLKTGWEGDAGVKYLTALVEWNDQFTIVQGALESVRAAMDDNQGVYNTGDAQIQDLGTAIAQRIAQR